MALTFILGVAKDRTGSGVRKTGPLPVYFFMHCPELARDDTPVRSYNFARKFLDGICANETGKVIEGYPDEKDYEHLWRVRATVDAQGRTPRCLSVEYQKFQCCGFDAAQGMNRIVAIFRQWKSETRPRSKKNYLQPTKEGCIIDI